MNGNVGAAPARLGRTELGESDEIDLRDVLAVLMAGKWWILGTVFVFTAVAAFYVTVASPIYEADALIQVEDEKPALSGLSELTEVLPSESAIGAEIEIVRSRSVLGGVVDDLGLTVQPEPVYFPLIGKFLDRRHSDESIAEPPFAFLAGYAWGGESIDLRRFDVSGTRRMVELGLVIVDDNNGFEVRSEGGDLLSEGEIGEVVSFIEPASGRLVMLNVRAVVADKGSRFRLVYVPRLAAIAKLGERLSVGEVGRDTGVMRLRIEGEDPVELEQILDSIANIYLRQNVERRSAEAQQSLSFLNEQLPEVRTDLEAAENRLAKFREKNQTIDLTIETESVLEKMVALDQRLSELELKRAELRRIYTGDHPLVQTLNEQRDQLQDEKKVLETQSTGLPDVQQDLLRYMREVEVTTQLYTYMLNKVQELRVVEAGTVGNVRILDHAAVSPEPVKPRKMLALALAVVVGGLISTIGLFIRRVFRTGITDPDEVERVLNTPVYAVLPFSEETRRAARSGEGLVTARMPESIIAEAFRSLRTSLHFGLGKTEAGAVVAISGPAPDVGKTFVAANIAMTLAKAGHRVLFVDGDMRRGDADKKLRVERAVGLSTLLVSDDVKEVIQQSADSENLWVIARGKSPPNPAELVMGDRFAELVARWRTEYDFVLLDTPPVLAVTDPVIIAKQADALFLVGRAGGTHIHELIESKTRFERGGVAVKGIVINGMTESIASGGQYGYGYGYYSYKYAPAGD
ncbi:MAG: tyrosine-protein kinase [Xanthomonadales bacterium]|jgi:tyrosine-protein kinase Etk/Wzc|nr:tyrosine-protein kinase [Xanthomonadales bacterium]